MGKTRPASNPNGAQNPLLPNTCIILKERKRSRTSCKICLVAFSVTFLLCLGAFLLVFLGFPLYFKNSVEFERSFIFQTEYGQQSGMFDDPGIWGINNTLNQYVTLSNASNGENVTLGLWHVLPSAFADFNITDESNYTDLLADSDYPVVLYFHGNGGVRPYAVELYEVLRNFFHIIAFDYRGYADSSALTPEEEAIERDGVELYKWVRERTSADIYIWGHSLGTSLGVGTAARLRDEDIIPKGIFLEAPFTKMREVVPSIPLARIFTWLPWFETMVLDPLDEHGFKFETDKKILRVDCPIMMVHAEDDDVIPYYLGQKLFHWTQDRRYETSQGNVTFHLLPASLKCSHMRIFTAPSLPNFIRDHIEICQIFNLGRG